MLNTFVQHDEVRSRLNLKNPADLTDDKEIGKAVSLAQNSVHDILSEIPKSEKPIIEMLDRDDVPTVAMLGWSQEMIGNCVDLSESAIRQRFVGEIPDLENLLQSRLNFKNPADLRSDAETPTPELLAWAIKL